MCFGGWLAAERRIATRRSEELHAAASEQRGRARCLRWDELDMEPRREPARRFYGSVEVPPSPTRTTRTVGKRGPPSMGWPATTMIRSPSCTVPASNASRTAVLRRSTPAAVGVMRTGCTPQTSASPCKTASIGATATTRTQGRCRTTSRANLPVSVGTTMADAFASEARSQTACVIGSSSSSLARWNHSRRAVPH